MKAVLISIRPKWVEKIVSGEKTLEVRKTRPKLETPFKCYIYCTGVKRSPLGEYVEVHRKTGGAVDEWQEKVMGEFTCEQIDQVLWDGEYGTSYDCSDDDVAAACLTRDELDAYGKHGPLYMWHISGLKLYGEPKELSEFCFPPELYCEKGLCGRCPYDQSPNEYGEYSFDCEWKRPITRPPQSWCYVEG